MLRFTCIDAHRVPWYCDYKLACSWLWWKVHIHQCYWMCYPLGILVAFLQVFSCFDLNPLCMTSRGRVCECACMYSKDHWRCACVCVQAICDLDDCFLFEFWFLHHYMRTLSVAHLYMTVREHTMMRGHINLRSVNRGWSQEPTIVVFKVCACLWTAGLFWRF